jgi:hypothetical protein
MFEGIAMLRDRHLRFAVDESGAVTVDWTVLTAGLVGLGLATMGVISAGVRGTTDEIRKTLGDNIIQTSFSPGYVLEDFATTIAGWAFSDNATGGGIEHSMEAGADGAPGFLKFTDDGSGGASYLGMTTPYQGDQTRLMDGTIQFDMKIMEGGNAIGDDGRWPILRITGANGETMTYRDAYAPETEGWSNFTADVKADAWRIGDDYATREQMEAILADVETSEIRVEQVYGREVIGMDNVRFNLGS